VLTQGLERLQELLIGFAIWWFISLALVCIFIVLIFSLAKALYRRMLWKRALFTFFKKYRNEVALLSVLIVLFTVAVRYNALFEYLVFLVMWLQLEVHLNLWRLEAGPHLLFRVVEESGELRLQKVIHIVAKNVGKVPVINVGIVRVFRRINYVFIPLRPEEWMSHVKSYIVSIPPGEEGVVAIVDELTLTWLLDKVLEVCYSTPIKPLPMSHCIHVGLVMFESGAVFITPLDTEPPYTPLLKVYKMLQEIPSLVEDMW